MCICDNCINPNCTAIHLKHMGVVEQCEDSEERTTTGENMLNKRGGNMATVNYIDAEKMNKKQREEHCECCWSGAGDCSKCAISTTSKKYVPVKEGT